MGKLAKYYLLATIDMDQVISYHRHCFPVLVHGGSWWMMRMMANLGHFHKFWNLAFVLPFKFRKKWLLLFLTVWSIATQFRLKFSDSITKINFPHKFVDTDFFSKEHSSNSSTVQKYCWVDFLSAVWPNIYPSTFFATIPWYWPWIWEGPKVNNGRLWS